MFIYNTYAFRCSTQRHTQAYSHWNKHTVSIYCFLAINIYKENSNNRWPNYCNCFELLIHNIRIKQNKKKTIQLVFVLQMEIYNLLSFSLFVFVRCVVSFFWLAGMFVVNGDIIIVCNFVCASQSLYQNYNSLFNWILLYFLVDLTWI